MDVGDAVLFVAILVVALLITVLLGLLEPLAVRLWDRQREARLRRWATARGWRGEKVNPSHPPPLWLGQVPYQEVRLTALFSGTVETRDRKALPVSLASASHEMRTSPSGGEAPQMGASTLPLLVLMARLPQPGPGIEVVHRSASAAKVAPPEGWEGTQILHKGFDARFHVRTDKPSSMAVLTDQLIAWHLELDAKAPAWSLSGNELLMTVEVKADARTIERHIMTLCTLATLVGEGASLSTRKTDVTEQGHSG